MSFPILINLTNQISQHQFRYKFSQALDLSQYEISLASVSIYYSWKAITAQRGNNKFKIHWPTADTTQEFTVILPDGTYTAADLDAYLQYWSIQNNLYLVNNTTGQNYYFLSCVENPSAYGIQFNLQKVQNITGYTAVSGFLTMPTSAYTPQIEIIDSGDNSFSSIIGYSTGTYPAAQSTSLTSVVSNLIP